MKSVRKILSVFAALVLCVCAMPAMNVEAAASRICGHYIDDSLPYCPICYPGSFYTGYTSCVGGTTTFDKYFVLDSATDVPTVAFDFTLTSGEAVALTPTTPAIVPGPAGGKLTHEATTEDTVTVSFSVGSTTYTEVQSGDTLTLPNETKYAKGTVTVDLTGVTFTTPGVYRWVITESGNSMGVVNDSVSSRYLDVYVVTDADGNLSIPDGGYVMHKTTDVPALNGAKPSDYPSNSDPDGDDDGSLNDPTGGNKSFMNTYNYKTRKLTLSTTTTGNQSDKFKSFVYVVTVTNPTEIFVESGSSAFYPTWTGDGTANGTFSGDDDSNSVYTTYKIVVSLVDGETGLIDKIPSTAQVSVATYLTDDNATDSENWIGHEGYVATYSLDSGSSTEWDGEATAISWNTNSTDHVLAMTLTKNVSIPTGINVNLLPWLLMLLLVVAAIVGKEVSKRSKAERE